MAVIAKNAKLIEIKIDEDGTEIFVYDENGKFGEFNLSCYEEPYHFYFYCSKEQCHLRSIFIIEVTLTPLYRHSGLDPESGIQIADC
jgi:hypothetical protein